MDKRGQQEIAGFVLIVVLVIVAMMVFLVISLKKPTQEVSSIKTENILSAFLEYTTDCVVSEPRRESMRDLIVSCYDNAQCRNLDISACTYLNQTVQVILPEILSTDVETSAFEFEVAWFNSDRTMKNTYLRMLRGVCNQTSSTVVGSSESISPRDGILNVNLKICTENL